MSLDWVEVAAREFEQPPARWVTPGAMAVQLDARTVQTPALQLIDQALVEAFNTPDSRLIITMPPQEGKSTRVARDFLIWALTQNPEIRIVAGSYGQGLANRNGRVVRNMILGHPELGLGIAPDNGSVHEWQIAGHQGGMLAVGRGGLVTGMPAELLVIDDPIKDRKEADSATVRDTCWEWWTESLSTRLAPGAPVVVIMTRWHEDDLVGRLLAAEDGHLWRVLNIPAEADHDPAKGESDPLGRQPGQFMLSARGRTERQWRAIRVRVGSRTWNALYQGRPAPAEGGVFKRDWWQEYTVPLWVTDGTVCRALGFDAVLASWDMAFKDTDQSDYVVGQVWAMRGADIYLLDQVRGRWDFPETLRQVRQLAVKWPDALLKVVEDKANGTAVLAQLRHTVPGLVAETPTESKTARAQAVAPLVEARNVHLPAPEIAAWVGGFIEECAAFDNGAHDDQVDAMSQALKRLAVIPLFDDDTDDDTDDEWGQISPM